MINFDLAKQLKEKGFRQNTEFRYEVDYNGAVSISANFIPINDHTSEVYASPSIFELLKVLPNETKNGFILSIERYEDGKYCPDYIKRFLFCDDIESLTSGDIMEVNLVNAIAKLWLFMEKEGYLT